jgi:glycosyltransferase involved in cell wall biosynthesis
MSSVSVIIPCYNCGHFLPAAIESVLAQTHRDLELIVADDSSTDNGVEIAERYIEVESFVECLQRCPDWAFAYGHQQFIDAAVTRHPQYESDYRLGIRRARSYWAPGWSDRSSPSSAVVEREPPSPIPPRWLAMHRAQAL